MNTIRDVVGSAIDRRGEATGAVVILTDKTWRLAFHTLDALDGEGEHEIVQDNCLEIGGDPRCVSVFRWPLGTGDTEIAVDLENQVRHMVENGGYKQSDFRPSLPVRHCWGDVGGEIVGEDFVNQVSVRVAQAKERTEIKLATTEPLPVNLLLTLHLQGDAIKWGLSVTTDLTKLWLLYEFDCLDELAKDASDAHLQEFNVRPKVILNAGLFQPLPMRTMVKSFAVAVANVTRWSRPYQDEGQVCHWLL